MTREQLYAIVLDTNQTAAARLDALVQLLRMIGSL